MKHYVECVCGSLEHVIRLWYDEEYSVFYIEYKSAKYPTQFEYYHNTTIKEKIIFQYGKLKNYLNNIRLAIFGRSYWWMSENQFTKEQASKLIKFMMNKIN